jgi:hypothetical protein
LAEGKRRVSLGNLAIPEGRLASLVFPKTRETPRMCHTPLLDSRFVEFLVRSDEEMAEEMRAAGCLQCGNALHLNSFPRKPRGIPRAWTEYCNYRLSFDCSVCSKRHTPPSVRFLERRVYLAFAVVLSCAVRTGLTDFREKMLLKWLRVPGQTIARWCAWWQQTFAKAAFFKTERGRFKPLTIEEATLPACLLRCFGGADLPSLQRLLSFLAPLSRGTVRRRFRV